MIPRGSRMGKIWPQKKGPCRNGLVLYRSGSWISSFFFFPGIRGAKKRGIIEREGEKKTKRNKRCSRAWMALVQKCFMDWLHSRCLGFSDFDQHPMTPVGMTGRWNASAPWRAVWIFTVVCRFWRLCDYDSQTKLVGILVGASDGFWYGLAWFYKAREGNLGSHDAKKTKQNIIPCSQPLLFFLRDVFRTLGILI